MNAPRFIGVRHHSPACARLVAHAIQKFRPRSVLIEGPADMNGRIGELDANHQLPVAIFSYHHNNERSHASWTPFCDYSPEWVALREGRSAGAEVRFMDLPAWAKSFSSVRNRYADGSRPRLNYVAALCKKLSIDGMDGLWDHLFELEPSMDALEAKLGPYFDALRDSGGDEPSDQEREAFMAQSVAAAVAQGGEVLVVCGGYHKPFLEESWRDMDPTWPVLPTPAKDARHGSYLVPYSFRRLDSFVGYESGMPSPAYYQSVWERGMGAASEHMLRLAVERLRAKDQAISVADLIAAQTMSRGLMRLRGHDAMARSDLLDGLAAALLKGAQDAPLPWTQRGRLRRGTDPLVVEIVAALSGERDGVLAAGTPQPPLVRDVVAELRRLQLEPAARPRTKTLDLAEAVDLERSRLLHRLVLLEISSFDRVRSEEGPLAEAWSIRKQQDHDSELVEAGAWGGTIETAAAARLENLLTEHGANVVLVARVLRQALHAGLVGMLEHAADRMLQAIENQHDISPLGEAMLEVLGLWRHDTVHGAAGHPLLARILSRAFDRGLWLFESLQGATAPLEFGHVRAAIALRDCVRFAEGSLSVDGHASAAVMGRRAVDPEAPVAVRGAALGYLWSLHELGSQDQARHRAVAAVRASAQPRQLGDFLTGVFGLAREQVTGEEDLLELLDRLLQGMTPADFLVAIPSLRMAFSFFPPREKDKIAQRVLHLYGDEDTPAYQMRSLPVSAEVVLAARALEQAVDKQEARYGLRSAEAPDDG